MSPACPASDPTLGTVLRLSQFLDCHARLLGENGFQALAGNVVATGLLSALVTIFVALIGYRFLLGQTPDLRDGTGWVLRLGFVLALVSSWPAFQTLAYRTMTDGPVSLAQSILPAAGLPSSSVEERAQLAYDTIRLGAGSSAPARADASASIADRQAEAALERARQFQFAEPLPKTAAAFLLSTVGVLGALRFATGLLLAVAPLAILGLLFEATSGLFTGWVRGVTGAALGVLGATVAGSLELVLVESELARLQSLGTAASAETVDAQALTSVVLLLALVVAATVVFAVRVPGSISLSVLEGKWRGWARQMPSFGGERTVFAPAGAPMPQQPPEHRGSGPRVTAIVDSLDAAVRREAELMARTGAGGRNDRLSGIAQAAGREGIANSTVPLGLGSRRNAGRVTRQGRRRDTSV